ncbi:hypothetical protein GCM10010910_01320 [Microbacterium nanhaiense]|uniref:Head-to-tail adaptor n=1 Tax=Microbacterium nanhaiense TaxID=1301026 RepID=A0ABQ2MWC5_9MICO|nr:hypothetical protein [Microbacterium nanhaiense]GGO59116.1 hypothetical protein GCM10010910_01320 [Microbacterium nanhaiense]
MAWPTVTIDDLVGRWRPLTPEEAAVAPQRIKDAESELRTELRLRGVDGIPTFSDPSEREDWINLYTALVVAAVKNELKNPEGWRSEREQLDDYGRTFSRGSNDRSGEIWFEDSDIDRLVPRPRRRRTAFTIRLGTS